MSNALARSTYCQNTWRPTDLPFNSSALLAQSKSETIRMGQHQLWQQTGCRNLTVENKPDCSPAQQLWGLTYQSNFLSKSALLQSDSRIDYVFQLRNAQLEFAIPALIHWRSFTRGHYVTVTICSPIDHAEKFQYAFSQLDLHSYIWHRATKYTTIYICNYKQRTVQVAHMREQEGGVQRSHFSG